MDFINKVLPFVFLAGLIMAMISIPVNICGLVLLGLPLFILGIVLMILSLIGWAELVLYKARK